MLTTEAGRFLRRIALPLAATVLVVAGLGLLVTRALDGVWPVSAEDGLVRTFADHRSDLWDAVSRVLSVASGAPAVIAGTLIAAGLALAAYRSWRAPLFLVGTVAAQTLVYLLVRMWVDRDRPAVPRLDDLPGDGSYYSGHTGAALALYGGIAVLLSRQLTGRVGVWVWRVLCLLVPLAVGLSRIYRGDNHPSDVLAAFVSAAAVLAIMDAAVLSPKSVWGGPGGNPRHYAHGRMPRAALVVNPIKLDSADDRARIDRIMSEAGWAPPLWLETTVEDPGAGVTRKALAEGVDLVVVAGGDGTVRECAGALAGTGVPLAVVPSGTGNLLARNLGLPIDLADAVHVAVHGRDRHIDLGGIAPDEPDGEWRYFTAMAGIGLDAAMVADAPDALKKKVGWPAYAVSAGRHLRDARMRVTLRIDDGPPIKRRARMVLVGNVGALQAGMQLLPGAEPDDGLLDVVVFAPYGMTGWAHATVRVIGRRRRDVPDVPPRQRRWRPIEHFTGRSVEVETARPEPRELDGDPIGPGTRLSVRVRPGALVVRVPDGRVAVRPEARAEPFPVALDVVEVGPAGLALPAEAAAGGGTAEAGPWADGGSAPRHDHKNI
ncbi:diacylglycerol kinase family protein [Yinghuangia soli]|uniref:Phosphatase PAP2 family protein n=1 Tax=Yinghuangia soli TaxID=2908204 RepID=A0AA41TX40_9ACTN|nr:diacylglycerol kinase family protein [Yinghuangia soli]MCF2526453.1 phosphatase PAP2 family protein [Yinghuangia soli]